MKNSQAPWPGLLFRAKGSSLCRRKMCKANAASSSAGNSFHVSFLNFWSRNVFVCENAFMLLSPPRNRILIFNGCWTLVQMPSKCSCMIFCIMQNIVWLWEVIYVVSPIKPSPLPQIEFEWCEHGKYQKGFSHLSKDGDNKNSYFAHTNNIMRFSSSERCELSNFMNSSLTFNVVPPGVHQISFSGSLLFYHQKLWVQHQ